MAQLVEPLLESAPLAHAYAALACHVDPDTGTSCAWDHGVWQYLRVLGLVTTPAQHAVFYREAVGAAASRWAVPAILVAGAADYCMLAQVLAACSERNSDPDVVVSDICETPLMLNRWYAARTGAEVGIRHCDILDHPESTHFGVVCTDSMLSRFPPVRRRELVAKWLRLLRPGGLVITANRLRRHRAETPFRYSTQQIAALRAVVLEQASSVEGLDLGPEELARAAVQYATLREIHPLSLDEIASLFREAGFVLDHLVAAPAATETQRWAAGAVDAQYAHIVARRP